MRRFLVLLLPLAFACQTRAVVVQRADCAKRCTGCCDVTGTCLTGEADEACGAPASACVACDSSEVCSNRRCEARVASFVDGGAPRDAGPTDTGADAGAEADAGVTREGCSADGWCLDALATDRRPLTTAHLRSVWARSDRDVWVAGDQGTVLHFDGTAWTPSITNIGDDLFGIWAASANDVWAVGGSGDPSMDVGVILHFDGTSWTAAKRGIKRIDAVWGGAANDVWFAGTLGTIFHWDGATITSITSPTTEAISDLVGTGSRAWAVGSSGLVLSWNGTTWQRAPITMTNGLAAVLSFGPDLIWVAGGNAFATYDGTQWRTLSVGQDVTVLGMWGPRPTWVWSVGPAGELQLFNGVTPTRKLSPSTNLLRDVHGTDDRNVWAVGFFGTVLRYQP